MSEDSKQIELKEIGTNNRQQDTQEALHPHIRQLGIRCPDNWEAVSLKEIGELDTSSVDKKLKDEETPVNLVNYMDVYNNYNINSEINYMEVTANDSLIERSQVHPGDILFTPSSEEPRDIGNSAVVTEEMKNTLHSYHTVRLRPTSDRIQLDLGFSGWLANAHYVSKQFARRATGSTRYTLTLGDFSDTQVLIPPISEQRKIATILYTIEQTIEKTSELIEQINYVKNGLMQDLFNYGISDEGTLRDPDDGEFQFSKTPVGNIPQSWQCVTLGKIIERSGGFIQTGPFGSQLHKEEYVENGVPVTMPQNIENGKIKTKGIAEITPEKVDDLSRHKMELNDVIIARRGDLSRASVITEREQGWICGTGCLLIRPPETEISGKWLQMAYGHPRTQHQINSRAVGSTMSNLNQSILQSLQLALPPVEEQERVVNTLSQINSRIENESDYLDQLYRVKKGVMQDLLSGTVRTTDTNIQVSDEVTQYG